MAKEYDLVILGAGTGGYVAAVHAAKRGLSTAVVEARDIGGTCLHRGCIPSKSYLKSAEVYKMVQESLSYGVEADNVSLQFGKVREKKNQTVQQLHKGVQQLLSKHQVDVYYGHGRILGASIFSPTASTISVETETEGENIMLQPKQIMLATGSRPATVPGLEIDGEYILSSEELLEAEKLPSSMVIVGGGVIGVEWASMLQDFGVEVQLVELGDRVLPMMDHAVSKEAEKRLKRKGVRIFTNTELDPSSLTKNGEITIHTTSKEVLTAGKMLVAVGRTGNTGDLGLHNTEVEVQKSFIQTSGMYQTKESHMYAIGDVIGGMQLAHAASREGIIAVEHMLGNHPEPLDYKNVPSCVYSDPEMASVGWTEHEATDAGLNIKTSNVPFQAIGKALVENDPEGFMKMIVDKETEDVLGVHIVGKKATELINEGALAVYMNASHLEIQGAVHAHPTLAEIYAEGALAVDGKAIHHG